MKGSAAAVLQVAAYRIDLPPQITARVLKRLEEEFIKDEWQLQYLDSANWNGLGAPMGLVASIRSCLQDRTGSTSACSVSSSVSVSGGIGLKSPTGVDETGAAMSTPKYVTTKASNHSPLLSPPPPPPPEGGDDDNNDDESFTFDVPLEGRLSPPRRQPHKQQHRASFDRNSTFGGRVNDEIVYSMSSNEGSSSTNTTMGKGNDFKHMVELRHPPPSKPLRRGTVLVDENQTSHTTLSALDLEDPQFHIWNSNRQDSLQDIFSSMQLPRQPERRASKLSLKSLRSSTSFCSSSSGVDSNDLSVILKDDEDSDNDDNHLGCNYDDDLDADSLT